MDDIVKGTKKKKSKDEEFYTIRDFDPETGKIYERVIPAGVVVLSPIDTPQNIFWLHEYRKEKEKEKKKKGKEKGKTT